MEIFETLCSMDFTGKTEKRKGGKDELTYLSWPHAWAQMVKAYPNATYQIKLNLDNLPYFADKVGAMVYTSVTGNVTRDMWLPVMDGANKAMRAEPYTYTVYDYFKKQNVEKHVAAYNMFDINKTIMRCLVKNCAMFGVGLYIYAGEDLPTMLDVDIKREVPIVVNEPLVYPTKLEVEQLITKGKDLLNANTQKRFNDLMIDPLPEDLKKIKDFMLGKIK